VASIVGLTLADCQSSYYDADANLESLINKQIVILGYGFHASNEIDTADLGTDLEIRVLHRPKT